MVTAQQPAERGRAFESFAASPLAQVESAFLRHLDPNTLHRIEERFRRVVEGLDAWATTYPIMRRERVVPLAISITAAAPFSPPAALVSAARVSLWVFALDDAIDEEWRSPDETRELARNCRQVLRGGSVARGEDPFLDALAAVRDDLTSYPLFRELGPVWADALRGTIDGMLREDAWRVAYREGSADLPSYPAYVANGRYSIGGPPHVWATILTIGDLSTPRHLARLRQMERRASICVRLSNDLRSAEKERREGKLNALVLLGAENEQRGMRPEFARLAAERRVRADIEAEVRRLIRMREAPVTRTGRPEAATADIAQFVSEFYQAHDYHTFSQESVENPWE